MATKTLDEILKDGEAHAMTMLHQVRALVALGADPAYDWLRDQALPSINRNPWWMEFIIELGRFESDDEIRRMAAAVSDTKRLTKQSVQRLRKARAKRTPAARSEALEAALFQCVRERAESHDAATCSWVIEAIDRLRARIASAALNKTEA